MAQTTSDVLVERLVDWGVDTVFGIPGDGINGIMEALRTRKDRIRFVQTRHEEAAAFMACGHARVTGKLGVCLATSGPGGIHLLNGLYDAKLDGQPVLAITGLPYHDLIGTHTQQDVELDKLFMDVAVYNQRVMGATHVANVTDLACRTALACRGVAHVTIPVDIQDHQLDEAFRSKRNRPHASDAFARGIRVPADTDLRRAAEVLNTGKKVFILAGRGALGAGAELEQVADTLGAPVAKALLGKAAISDDSPYTTGPIGLLGSGPSQEAAESCDTLLIVGSSFPYIEFYPKPAQALAVQIDTDAARIGLRYPVEAPVAGDARESLKRLLPLLERKADRGFLEKAQRGMREWRALMEERGSRRDIPMKPQVVAYELGKRLRDDAIVTTDSGTITTWWARQVPAKRGQVHILSGNLATMACGLPYANAAQLAYPDRQVVAFVGDGAFSMLMAEVLTAVKYRLPIKVVVIKNNTLGQIKWEQMVFLGNPEYGCELQPMDYAGFAEVSGMRGFRIEDPKTCGRTLDEALAVPGPALVEAVVDPFEPPMPGRVSLDQAAMFARSLVRGEPNRAQIALTAVSNKVRELV